MSRENVELVKALIPQGTDIAPLFRDEDSFARMREVVSPVLTDDFQSVMVFLGQTRTYAGLEGLRQNWLDWLEPEARTRPTGSCCSLLARPSSFGKGDGIRVEPGGS
jgi:hypothetical protein